MIKIDIKIDENDAYKEIEIIIKCPKIDTKIERLIEQINKEISIVGKIDGRTYSLFAKDLYYVESIDNKTFLYDQQEVYESDLKLYEIEQLVAEINFLRISKNMIVNMTTIESVLALFNGRFEASLTNDEKLIVNRHYVKAFKMKFLT